MPCNYKNYPPNWHFEIRPRILERDGNKCKFCGVKNYAIGYRDSDGKFVYSNEGRLKIVLTIAHLNHDTTYNRDENLAALCQKCHLNYDKEFHKKNAAETKARELL